MIQGSPVFNVRGPTNDVKGDVLSTTPMSWPSPATATHLARQIVSKQLTRRVQTDVQCCDFNYESEQIDRQ